MVENAWWIEEWGNPCRECGFDWAQSPEAVIAAVEALPAAFDALLAGHTGDETAADAHPGASWSAKAYVFHVADNLRIFAERLEGVFAGAPTMLAAYDQDELAAARNYDRDVPAICALVGAHRDRRLGLSCTRVAQPSVHLPARGTR